nr:MAG: RNA-dependent RNA polymerase [Sanya botourmia-like virus 18]
MMHHKVGGQESLGLYEPLSGVRLKRCSCRQSERRTKEVIENALKIVRVRFGLPSGELPYLEPSRLSIYLLSLLSSSPSPLRFPRAQRGFDLEGFPVLIRLGRLERWRLASCVASIKRALPNEICEAHPPPSCFPSWSKRQCQETRTSSSEYRAFARQVAAEVFRPGWDRTYRSFCRSFVPKAKARAEKLACGLYWNASAWWSEHSSREEYLDSTIRGKLFSYDHPSRYKEVPTAGKVRPMIIPSVSIDLLGPLHKTMYQHMASQPWLLKGKPSVERLRCILEQEWKTSVDLVNATDGLTLDVCEIALDVCQSNARDVPAEIFLRARRSLTPLFTHDGDFYRIASGQMMGQYLSFPLLCFQSYVAARWATRGLDAKFAINGDDCLIGCSSRDVVNRYPEHLVMNKDKTAVRRTVAEINSTQFISWGKKWKEVVTARRLGGDNVHLSGLEHMAQSCLNAGDRWVTAFVRTRIGRRSRIAPNQLGLPTTNREVFWRLRGMPSLRVLPEFRVCNDERLEIVYEKPCEADAEELRTLLFNEGRYVPKRKEDVKIKDLPYVPSPVSTMYVPNVFSVHRKVCKGEKKQKKEIYFRVRRDTKPVETPLPRIYQSAEGREILAAYESIVDSELQTRTENWISNIKNRVEIVERGSRHLRGRSTYGRKRNSDRKKRVFSTALSRFL